ncbi:hypothetical protein SAMN03080614_104914 [Anaerobranca gottschalkii DSM 13577]|uniref:HTH merR-type domain-containing protein n=1 Tax=Anaerobranca gottschalkii DSM 13577 TaxID=1120990 RepID=A0A1I0BV28_9FIRM|nr:hypothetical protein SAMN03080614_104914 [Anaerobranca gottschalkii DSM 13577]
MKYYNIGKFAKLIGKNPQTLREWDKKGKRANKVKKMIKELVEDDKDL